MCNPSTLPLRTVCALIVGIVVGLLVAQHALAFEPYDPNYPYLPNSDRERPQWADEYSAGNLIDNPFRVNG